jgi:hypothetical protein
VAVLKPYPRLVRYHAKVRGIDCFRIAGVFWLNEFCKTRKAPIIVRH